MKSDTYISSGFELFSAPGVNFSVTDSSLVNFFPLGPLDVSNPVEYFVNSSISDPYLDLSSSYLYVKFHVTINDKDGERGLTEEDNVSIANNFLHSLFSSTDVYLQETLIDSNCNNNSNYRGYLHNLLNYSAQDKNTTLAEEGFYKDTQGKFDEFTQNEGAKSRKKLLYDNQKVVMIGKPSVAIFQSIRFLPAGTSLRIRFTLAKPEFLFFYPGSKRLTLHLDDCILYLRKITPSPNVRIAVEDELMRNKALFPVTETSIKTYTIAANSQTFSADNIIAGKIPRQIIFGLLRNEAYLGDTKLNPFNFQTFKLNKLNFFLNGKLFPPCPLDDDGGTYARAYRLLMESSGTLYKNNSDNAISRKDFCNGNALFFFNLTPDLYHSDSNNPIFETPQAGNARLELSFGEVLPHNVTLICYQTFDRIYSIDFDRNVFIDL